MSEEEIAMLKQAQEEAEENKNEVMFAKKEIEELKRELWECQREKKKLEDQGPGEDVGLLEAQVDELKGINEDLDLEVKTLKDQVEQKEDELVVSCLHVSDFRICCKNSWWRKSRKLWNWKLDQLDVLMRMSWQSRWRTVDRKSRLSTRYFIAFAF